MEINCRKRMNGFCTGCPDNCREAFRGTSLTQRFCRGELRAPARGVHL